MSFGFRPQGTPGAVVRLVEKMAWPRRGRSLIGCAPRWRREPPRAAWLVSLPPSLSPPLIPMPPWGGDLGLGAAAVPACSRACVLPCSAEFGLFCSSCSSYLPRIAAEGPALAGSVAEQDRQCRGASGTDEASRAQPQLQPNFVHLPR